MIYLRDIRNRSWFAVFPLFTPKRISLSIWVTKFEWIKEAFRYDIDLRGVRRDTFATVLYDEICLVKQVKRYSLPGRYFGFTLVAALR